MRKLDLAGRSPVHSTHGMAATSHPLATLAALNVLQDGGNAIDAAVAAAAVQCVVEPQSTGIGGDCFALFAMGGGEVRAINGSGRAPAAISAEDLLAHGIPVIGEQSPHAVTVPGAVDAWARLLEDYGTRSLGALLQPAIAHARDGYPVHSRVAVDWADCVEVLNLDPTAARIFLPDGKPPAVGSLHRQTELAETLERIAKEGRDGFYAGPVAEDIVHHLNHLGGVHSLEDFASARADYVTPIKTAYRGYEVYECPPNGQGIVALEMLNILSGFELSALEPLSPQRLHLEIEATRLAYRDRDDLLADPDKAEVPVEEILSDARAAALRERIDPKRAMGVLPPNGLPRHRDTVYISVVDRERNAVSFINSLFGSFGTCLVSPETGVVLHNRGTGFVVEPGHPNCIAPGKRPLHTIIPGMLAKGGRVVMPFGVMGGHYQPVGHCHLLTNLIDFGLDLQESIDLPRVFADQAGPVLAESGIPVEAVQALAGLGHDVVTAPHPLGGAQAIMIDWQSGVLTGASEPRKDGCALGY